MLIVAVICAGCCCGEMRVNAAHVEGRMSKGLPKECPKMLRHVVLFKFKDGTTPEKIKEVENSFAALPGKIELSRVLKREPTSALKTVRKVSRIVLSCRFRVRQDRDAYLDHPAHKEFGKSLGGCLDKVLVVDYWNK